MAAKSCVFKFADLEVREGEFSLARAGEVMAVEPKAFRVLLLLLRNPGKLLTKEEVLNAVWGETAVSENSLTRAVALLRRLLGDEARDPRFIETVATVGYRFICKVEVCEDTTERTKAPATPEGQDPGLATGVSPSWHSDSGTQSTIASSETKKRSRRAFWLWPLIAALALILAWLLRPTLPPPEVAGTTRLTHDGVNKVPAIYQHPPLLTDGSRLYFHEIGPVHWPMTQVSTEGGETAPLDIPLPPYSLADITPDGRALVLGAWPPPNTDKDLQLWRVPVDPGTQPRRVGNTLIDWMAATQSPDGKVLYYSLHSDLFAAEADGSHPRKLLTIDGAPFWLRASPDGRLLRFTVVKPNGQWLLFEVHTDGSRPRQLLSGFANESHVCCGNWTTDGRYFVFESIQGNISTLWSIRDAGDLWHRVNHEPVQLTHGELSADCPLPSKDGKKVFFIGILRRGELMRYDLQTHTLVPFLPGFSAAGLDFTKDGKRMVYTSFPEGTLWQSRIDGTDRHQLTFPPLLVSTPRWSPDGSQIAFSGIMPGKPNQVFLIPSGGGTPEQLTENKEDTGDPTWSPDGNSLAYAGPWDSRPTTIPIRILNLRTREVTPVPDSAGLYSPRWSPDGRYLLASPLGTKSGIVLYDFNRRSWQQLLDAKYPAYPSWSQNSQCVYFNDSNLEYRVCLADRKVQQIADMAKAGDLAFTSAGDWTGLAPDGSILALRDTSTEEIYALDVKLP